MEFAVLQTDVAQGASFTYGFYSFRVGLERLPLMEWKHMQIRIVSIQVPY